MTMKITTHYKEALTSQMLNYKVETMVGENKVVEGFEVSKNNNNITISPGKCIINGAIIESDEDVTIEVPHSLQGSSDFQVIAKYSHSAKSVNFYVYEIGRSLDGNELLLSKSMTDASKIRTLTDLSASLKSIKENLAEDQVLEYENEFITSTDSVEGATTELRIKGQTIVNVAPIKDEVDVYADLQATSGGSVKFNNTGDGIIDGINIKGKTYQNIQSLTDGKSFPLTATADGTQVILARADLLVKPSTKYTLVAKISQNTLNHNAMLLDWSVAASPLPRITVDAGYTGLIIQGFTSSDNPRTWSNIHIWKEATRGSITIDYVMILEGDHTNNPDLPSYFEGIIGVGDKSKNLLSTNLISGRIGEQGQWYEGSTLSTTTEFIPVMPNKTYTISKNGVAQQSNIFLYDRNKCLIKKVDNASSTFNTTNNCYFVRLYWNRTTVDLKDKVQIEEGVRATPYEEHYHGYKVEVLSCGKNLFDQKNIHLISYSDNALYYPANYKKVNTGEQAILTSKNRAVGGFVKLKKNTKYILYTKKLPEYTQFNVTFYDDKSKITTANSFADSPILGGNNLKIVFTTPNYNFYTLVGINASYSYIMNNDLPIEVPALYVEEYLESDSQSFEEYKESKARFVLDQPLMSLPNGVCDEIVGNKLIRRVGKIGAGNIDGWYVGNSIQQTENTMMFATFEFDSIFVPGGPLICNKFKNHDTWDIDFDACNFATNGDSRLRIRISRSRLETEDIHGFRKWLQDNEVVFYGELANPIITPIDNDVVMPNGVHDEITRDKAIRKVRKRILDGTEEWNASGSNPGTSDYVVFYHNKYEPHNFDGVTRGVKGDFLCDGIFEPMDCRQDTSIDSSSVTGEYITGHFSENIDEIRISILKRRLDTLDAAGFRKWLSENPTTIWYELKNPYEGPADNSVILPNGVRDEYVDGKVLRKVGKVVLDGSENWTSSTLTTDTHRKQYVMIKENNVIIHKPQTALICDSFKVTTSLDEYKKNIESVFSDKAINISIEKSRLPEDSLDGFKKWLKENPVTVYFELKEPYYDTVKIPKLNSYKSQTNVIGSTFVPTPFNIESYGYRKEALIKPNTQYAIHFNNKYADADFKNIKVDLGGAIGNVTANNSWLMLTLTTPATLKHNELRISGYGIKVSNVMCSEGSEYRDFIDGLASVGDKSKNLFNGDACINGFTLDATTGVETKRDNRFITDFIKVEYDEVIYITIYNSLIARNLWGYDLNKEPLIKISNDAFTSGTFVIPKNVKYIRIPIAKTNDDIILDKEMKEAKILISKTPISYESYYDGHKIEILSCGKNLFDVNNTQRYNFNATSLVINVANEGTRSFTFKIKANTTYCLSGATNIFTLTNSNCARVLFTNEFPKEGIVATRLPNLNNNVSTIRHDLSGYVTLVFLKNSGNWGYSTWFDNASSIQIEESSTPTAYTPYVEDKIQILLQEPLRSLPNGVCDTIEEVDGNYVVVRRCGEVTLGGDNDWLDWIFRKESSSHDQIRAFRANSSWLNMDNIKPGSSIYTDVRITASHAWNTSAWYDKTAKIAINNNINQRDAIELMFKTELGIDSIEKFNKYMVKNPIKLIYKLATPTTHPLNHLVLPNKVADEVRDGKRIKKVGKVILDGSENWQAFTDDGDYIAFTVLTDTVFDNAARPISNSVTNVLSPSFKSVPNKDNGGFMFNCISLNPWDNFWVRIQANQLETPDVAGFKKWLKDNPTTVWYELETPTEEDYNSRNLNLDTYNETTHIASNTLVPAIINAKIPTNVGAVIKNDIRRIEVIEDLIDKVVLPQLVESHYEKTLLEFDYQVSRMLK